MLSSVLAIGLSLLSLGTATILQNGQVRITDYPNTAISLSNGSYHTYDAGAEEIHYMGRWDSKHVSHWSAPGIRFGFTGSTVAVTFGEYTNNGTLVAYRLSGLKWQFTNITTGGTHQFISASTPGVYETQPFQPNVFEMRVTNWAYGVQVESVHVAANATIVKPAARSRTIEFIGDSLMSGLTNSYEGLFSHAYGVGEGFGDTEYSITAYPGVCVTDQACFGIPRGQSHQWFYTTAGTTRTTEIWGDEQPVWDFSAHPAADLVIINLGTNDANSDNDVDPEDFVRAYKLLIEGVHGTWPSAQIIMVQLWIGFYQSGNSYVQVPEVDDTVLKDELYSVYEYFNSEEYLSAPIIYDGVTEETTTLDERAEPFVHWFSTDGILQHNDITVSFHPTDVGQIKVASHLTRYINMKFGWEMVATGPEVWADTVYWNDEPNY